MQIAVVGVGYVGLVTGACLAEMGHYVACHDADTAKISHLLAAKLPIYEPGLTEIVQLNAQAGRLTFHASLKPAVASAEICFIAVGTPALPTGAADVSQTWAAVDAIAEALTAPCVIVMKSTVPPGTCEAMSQALRKRGHAFVGEVVSNPEFLKEGMAVDDFRRPDRIVVGAAQEDSVALMRRLYEPFLRNGHPLLVMTPRSAELTKYASNMMLAARISLVNELAQVCDAVGADISEVRQGMGSDKRLGMAFLYAGLGYGGSCFPKDVQALQAIGRATDVPTPLFDAVHSVNTRQKTILVRHLLRYYPDLAGRRIAVWGLAFKPRTDDVREAPALATIAHLIALGAEVIAYDPIALDKARAALPAGQNLHYAEDRYSMLQGVDALFLCTEWDLFRSPDFAQMRRLMKTPLVLDGRNQYDPTQMRKLGFRYACVGRASLDPTRHLA